MTEALDAMVKAMHAEFCRQIGRESPGGTDHGWVGELRLEDMGGMTLDGGFDLEKVARAGLAAIREPGEAAVQAGRDTDSGGPGETEINVETAFTAIIDHILA